MATDLELRDFIKGGNQHIVNKILSKEIPLDDNSILNAPPPYPAASIDEAKIEQNPLLTTKTLQLHVYDYDAPVVAESLSTVEICKQNWQSGGLISFKGDGKSLVVAGQTVENATWDPTKSVLSWSAQSCNIPVGSLSVAFSNEKITAVGAMSDASGQEVTIAGTNLAYYNTKRYKDGTDPNTAEDFATFTYGAAPPEAGSPLEPVYHLSFKPGQNPSMPNGGMDDISEECVINPSLKLSDPLVIKKGYDEEHAYAFEITFDSSLDSFTGIFEEGPLKEKYHWIGTETDTPPPVIHEEASAPDFLTPIFNLAVPAVTGFFQTSPEVNPPPSYGAATEADAEKPAQASFASNSNNELKLHDLLHMSSIRTAKVKIGEKEQYVVKDYAQECAGRSFNNILLASAPDQTREKLFPNVLPLTEDEIKIKTKNSAFFNRAGTPYLAMYIAQSPSVDPNVKKHIDLKKVHAFFNAAGSFKEPEKDDPVKELGWDRKSDDFKNLQNAFVSQNLDLYRLGYTVGVPTFKPFLSDPKRWHDELSAYLTTPKFLAVWGVQNSLLGYADGRRQLYEYETQLQCLQVAAEEKGLKVKISTMDVIEKLTAAMLIPSFDQVNWTDEMELQFQIQLNTIMGFSKEHLDEIMKESMEKYLQYKLMRELIELHGDTKDFTKSVSKVVSANASQLKEKGASGSARSSINLAESQSIKTFSVPPEEGIEVLKKSLGPAFNDQAVNELRTSKWRKCWDACKNVGTTIWAVLKPVLYIAGAAYAIHILCNDPGIMDPLQKAQLGGIALEMSITGLSKIIQSKFGDWLRKVLLDKKTISRVLGEWFTEKGVVNVAADTKAGKALLACFGKSCGDFLQYRVGPAMALIALGVTSWQLYRSVTQGGTTHDIVFASINVALALVSAVVVFVGLFGKGATAAACGPIGLAIVAIGLIVFAIEYLTRDKPPPQVTPTEAFVNGPLKTAGFYVN